MKSKSMIKISALIIILLGVVLLLPFPQIINTKLSASGDTDNEYTLSVNALKLNYLIKADEFIPQIKLYAENNLIFDNSSNKVKTTVYKVPSQDKEKHIEYTSFYFYNSYQNKMDIATLQFDNNKGYFVFTFDNSTYIAPAENSQDADNIISYLEIDNITRQH